MGTGALSLSSLFDAAGAILTAPLKLFSMPMTTSPLVHTSTITQPAVNQPKPPTHTQA